VGILLFLTVKDPPKQQTQQKTDSTGQIQTQGIGYKAKRVLTKFFNPSVIRNKSIPTITPGMAARK
jgi:hypothetical protein